MDPQVAERFVRAVLVFDELGAQVEEVTFGPERNDVMFQDFFDYFAAKGYACLGQFLDDRKSREQLTDYFRETLEHGRSLSAADCYRSLNKIGFYRAETARFFGGYDLLLTPVTSVWAFPIGRPPEVVAGRRLSKPGLAFLSLHLFVQCDGESGGQRPLRFLRRRAAHRAADRGPLGRRGDGAGRFGGV